MLFVRNHWRRGVAVPLVVVVVLGWARELHALAAPATPTLWLEHHTARWYDAPANATGLPYYQWNAAAGRYDIVGEEFSTYDEYDPASPDPDVNSAAIRAYFSPLKTNPDHPTNIYHVTDPAGVRVLVGGHSDVKAFMPSFAELGFGNGHTGQEAVIEIGSGNTGSPTNLWGRPDRKERLKDCLRTGTWDHLVLTVFPDSGQQAADYRPWIDLGRQYNPGMRFYIQGVWIPSTSDNVIWRALMDWADDTMTGMVADLNAEYGEGTVTLIPVHQAVLALLERGEAGLIPGYTGLAQLNNKTRGAILTKDGVHPSDWLTPLGGVMYYHTFYGNLPNNPIASDLDNPSDPYDAYSQYAVALETAMAMGLPEPSTIVLLGIGFTVTGLRPGRRDARGRGPAPQAEGDG